MSLSPAVPETSPARAGDGLLIGLTGPAGCGKSTAAGLLVDRHGFQRLCFAGPLKGMLAALLASAGLEPAAIAAMIDGDLKETPCAALQGRTPRHAMQTLGAEWGRGLINPLLWTQTAVRAIRARRAADPAVRLVLDDVRYPDEERAIAALGGTVVAMVRPGPSRLGAIEATHASETHTISATHRLLNDGPPEVLAARLEGLLRRLGA